MKLNYGDIGRKILLKLTGQGLKVTKGNKLKFSPHQIAFHVRHPKNTFILAMHLASSSLKLYEGKVIEELVACGLKLDACREGLDACRLKLENL